MPDQKQNISGSSYYGNDYTGNSSSGGYGSGDYSGGGGYGYAPVVLDLAGKGINVTQLTSSNTYEDVTGSGYKNRTAWAGVGNGVLFIDTTGQGQLTQANQIIFTDWDPGAKSDMQALEDVFDTNHDGSLDAGDADYNDFFVMVTNANGTQTAYSLAELGITSINLNANATNVALPDGSSIDGETTFTMTNPTTGVTTTNAAATVTLATDSNGYVVATTDAANSDGSETVANVASNADGSLAYESILNTSADGLDKTLTTLNNGGVVTTIQTDDTVDNADGSTTETLTNYAGGTIEVNGELTAAGTTGSEKLNSTTTNTTSANGDVVTILRDQLGGGWTTQEEVDTINADGSTSIVLSDLNFDGSTSNVTTTDVSADGLTRTVTSLVDGITADSTLETDATVVDGTTRTETVTDSVGTTVTSLVTTVTETTADSVTRTATSDLTDGTTLDLNSVAETVTNADASTTTTQTDTAANGTLLDETVTQLSADGLLKTTSADSTGATSGGAPTFDTVVTDDTVVNSDGSRTETVTTDSASGTQLSQSVTTRAATGAARTVTTYGNGDGAVTQSETVTVDATTGATTDTVSNLNADGSLINQTVTVTSANGLSKSTQVDSTGATAGGASVFDHATTDVTVDNADGSSTEIVTEYGASTSDLIAVTETTVSADGLTTTVDSDFTGAAGVADGSSDQISVDQTVVNADGSLTKTTTVSDGNGHVLTQTVKTASADRRTVTTTTTEGTSGLVNQVQTVTTQSNGTVVNSVINFDKNGDVLNALVTTTSADGLTKIVQDDIQGQTAAAYAASGLAFDSTTTETTVINADGSRTETTNVTSQNGTLVSTSIVTTTANGLSITTTENPYATVHYASQSTDVTTLNADGSRTETVSDDSYSGALTGQTKTTTSADGLSTTILYDLNGDGVTDQSLTNVTTINASGSRTEIVTDYTGGITGTVRDVTTTTSGTIVAGAGLETTITRQSNGSVPTYEVETIPPSANGTVTDTVQYYASSGGPLLKTVTTSTSADGLTKTVSTEIGTDTTPDFSTSDTTVLDANGSETETIANTNKAGLISETVMTTTANGLFKATDVDANGVVSGSTPVFNLVTTDDTALNASDGSTTETINYSNAVGATISKVVKTTSADQQNITTDSYLDETGTIGELDQVETIQTQSNGSIVDTVVSYGPTNTLLGTVTTTTSGNGLNKITTYQNAAGATIDTQSNTETYDADGDGGTLDDLEDADVVNGTTLASSLKKHSTANDQTSTTTLVLTGALASTIAASFSVVTNDGVAIADTGVSTQTITDAINGVSSASDTTTIVTSANGLQTTSSTALGSSNPYIQSTTTTNLDGSKTVTTTYYNPANLGLIEEQATVGTSYDGRTVTTTQESDYDGTGYNVQTDQTIENADGSETETRSGTGSFGAGGFDVTTTIVTDADDSQTTTTLNYNASDVLIGQMASIASADELVQSLAVDSTGTEAAATLNAAAGDLLSGSALPTSLLSSDILGLDVKTLNADGSTTETDKTYFGSLSTLRSQTVTTTSANGLVTTQKTDSDGNGTFEEVNVRTRAPDGSTTEVMQYYANAGTDAGQLAATNTLSTSANGLVAVLTTSTGVTDTTTTFANANGSYQWARNVTGTASGLSNGSASHDIDANGIDTWSWSDGSPGGTSGTITIDVATENQDIAAANMIYTTVLGHCMTDAETQYLAQYISNGVLNRTELATALVNSSEYSDDYGGVPLNSSGLTFQVYEDFLNVLGRLPTASELATFDPASMQSTTVTPQILAQTAVAIAQYATDWTGGGVSVLAGSGQGLAASFAPPVGPAQDYAIIGYSGGYSAEIETDIPYNDTNYTIPGDDSLTVDGTDDSIDAAGANDTVILNGADDSVSATEAGDVVDVNAANDLVTGDGSAIDFTGSGETLTVDGSGNDFVFSGSDDTLIENQTTFSAGVVAETDTFSVDAGVATQISTDLNFADGGSQQELFNPEGGVTAELLDYAQANETGNLTETDSELSSGGSQIQYFDPYAGVSLQQEDFAGAFGSGTMVSEDVNFTDGTSQQLLFSPESGVSKEFFDYSSADESGSLTEQGTDFTSGGSKVEYFDPSSGVSSETYDTTGTDGGGTVTSTDTNFASGTSQQELFSPQSGVSEELLDYAQPNEAGGLTETDSELTSGGSQIQYVDPYAGVTLQQEDFTGSFGSGTMVSEDLNFTGGTSQQLLYNPESGVSTEFSDYSSPNESGTLTEQGSDFTAGGSQVEYFDPSSGVSSETYETTGTDGGGTVTSTDTNFTSGTSQQELFSPQSGVSEELLDYAQPNESGLLVETDSELISGGSQLEYFYPVNGVLDDTQDYPGSFGGGALTSSNLNFTDGASELETFDPTTGVSEEYQNYSGANETGTLENQGENFTSGGSELTEYDPSSGVSQEALYYAGENETGALSDIYENLTSGGSDVIEYNPTSGVSQEIFEYGGENETGALNDIYQNLTSGGSDIIEYDPSSAISEEVLEYAGENDTGGLTSETIDVGGSGDVAADGATIVLGSNETITVDGYDNAIQVEGPGDTIYASSNTIYVSSGDVATVDGTFDVAEGAIDWEGAIDGDSWDGRQVDTLPTYTGSDSSGAAAGVVRRMNVVAQYDLSHSYGAAATAAEAAEDRSDRAIAASTNSGFSAPSPFNGIRWAPGSVITWSFAASSSTGPDPVSGTIQAQYQEVIEQALATWAAASGLTFERVASSVSSDVQIGWGDFDTGGSGLVGYTSGIGIDSGSSQSLLVRLEDPTQTALIAGPGGTLTYAGSQTTLYQTALHEIGHVLGIAETSDPNSVMYPLLGSGNQTLDATDIADIQELYGPPAAGSPSGADSYTHSSWGGGDGNSASSDHPLQIGMAASDSALIGRGTGEMYAISSGFPGWMRSNTAGGEDTGSLHYDHALFDIGAPLETAGTLASNAANTFVSNGDLGDALRRQQHIPSHMAG